MEKTRPVVSGPRLRLVYPKKAGGLKDQGVVKNRCPNRQDRYEKLSVCTSWRGQNGTALLFPFLSQTVLAKLFYSR